MRIETVTAPEEEPLSLEEARLFCRVDADLTDEDALIQSLITAAREQIEVTTSRALAPQTLRLVLDAFPRERSLLVPRAPLIEVVSIKYDDVAGDEQTLDAERYLVVTHSSPGAIIANAAWPATDRRPGAVRITFECGHGKVDGETQVSEPCPGRAITAMKYLVNHWYERREAVLVGTTATTLPMAVKNLIYPLKLWYSPSR